MRILHITRIPATVSTFLLPLLKEHKRRGDYVAVCCAAGQEMEIIKNKGIDCFIHRFKQSLNPLNFIRAFFDIRNIIKQQKFDVVVYHTPMISMVARIAAFSCGVKNKIYFAHGLPCAPMQNRLRWLIAFGTEWILGRITDGLLVMNNYDEKLARKKRLIKNPENIYRINGMGVDTDKYFPEKNAADRLQLLKEFDAEWANKIVISTGRLIKTKGYYEYINAAFEILKKRDDVLFLLAGSGPELDGLKVLIETKKQTEKIKILGWRNDIDRLTRIADIFTLPTYFMEGMPVSILEAMACGKPVVATKHRGCEDEVIDGCTGYLVEPKSVSQLAVRMMEILDDDGLAKKMGQSGRKRIEEEFELNKSVSLIIESLYSIIK